MGFYFKDGTDQLLVRRGSLPAPVPLDRSGRQWTDFNMPLRQPSPMLNAFDLTRFVATSLPFMRNLEEVTIWMDDVRLSIVQKTVQNESNLDVASSLTMISDSSNMAVSRFTSRGRTRHHLVERSTNTRCSSSDLYQDPPLDQCSRYR
jgi:hypothetical protein